MIDERANKLRETSTAKFVRSLIQGTTTLASADDVDGGTLGGGRTRRRRFGHGGASSRAAERLKRNAHRDEKKQAR